ncbi:MULTISPECIES: GFA family protein [unclassified Phenylobacterium]|uniref:GFA family protein n=1 Tax=unclassified Phenylobacterium TaxID=2640670 RepID=UPI003F4F7A74
MGEFTRDGGCRCGQVRFRISAPPLITMACHCTGCQKMTASAFSLSVLTPAAGFAVIDGEPVIGGLHGATRHFFCPHCKSWMFTRPDGAEHLVNVRTTLLDDPSGLEPYMETMTAEKLPWASTPAVESFEGFPPVEAYAPMMKAFAAGRAGG